MSITRWRAAAVAALHAQGRRAGESGVAALSRVRRSGRGAIVWNARRGVGIAAALLAMSITGPGAAGAQSRGEQVFSSTCTFCHFTDTTDRKVGPGLMGLFRRERLPVSGDSVSDERVRKQIRQGSGAMPPHGHLSAADVDALVQYLKTL